MLVPLPISVLSCEIQASENLSTNTPYAVVGERKMKEKGIFKNYMT